MTDLYGSLGIFHNRRGYLFLPMHPLAWTVLVIWVITHVWLSVTCQWSVWFITHTHTHTHTCHSARRSISSGSDMLLSLVPANNHWGREILVSSLIIVLFVLKDKNQPKLKHTVIIYSAPCWWKDGWSLLDHKSFLEASQWNSIAVFSKNIEI